MQAGSLGDTFPVEGILQSAEQARHLLGLESVTCLGDGKLLWQPLTLLLAAPTLLTQMLLICRPGPDMLQELHQLL